MKKNEAISAVIEYFKENEDVFNDCIESLDCYNGYLGDDRYYPMDELNELYDGQPVDEILRRAFYGYDAETYTTDKHGEKEYGPFNPNRDYFTFNGYGNLISADYKDYSGFLDEYAVKSMIENRNELWNVPADLDELFDAVEESEE